MTFASATFGQLSGGNPFKKVKAGLQGAYDAGLEREASYFKTLNADAQRRSQESLSAESAQAIFETSGSPFQRKPSTTISTNPTSQFVQAGWAREQEAMQFVNSTLTGSREKSLAHARALAASQFIDSGIARQTKMMENATVEVAASVRQKLQTVPFLSDKLQMIISNHLAEAAADNGIDSIKSMDLEGIFEYLAHILPHHDPLWATLAHAIKHFGPIATEYGPALKHILAVTDASGH